VSYKVPFGVIGFDAWYLAEDLIQVLARRRKDRISLLKKNRLLETASFHLRDANGWTIKLPGTHLAVEAWVPLIPATAYRPVTVGEHTYWCFTLAVRIPGLGKVRLVVSFEQESLTGRYIVLVTNRLDCSPAKIISLYSQRWPTETFDQDGQWHLGFNAYRLRSAEAIGKHWCVVFVASSLLHLTCLPTGPGRTQGLIHPLVDSCRQQGRALLKKQLVFVYDQLFQGAPIDQVFAQVLAKQQGLALV
jgi:Transposase DDE domain